MRESFRAIWFVWMGWNLFVVVCKRGRSKLYNFGGLSYFMAIGAQSPIIAEEGRQSGIWGQPPENRPKFLKSWQITLVLTSPRISQRRVKSTRVSFLHWTLHILLKCAIRASLSLQRLHNLYVKEKPILDTDHSLVLLLVLPAEQWRVKAQRRRRHREPRGRSSTPFSSAAAAQQPQPRPPLSEIPPRRPSQPWNMTWLEIKLRILVFWWWRLVICLSGSVSNPDKGECTFQADCTP